MESSKPMETPLAGNWRKEDATSCAVVEATIYKQFVGLMYLVNTQLNMLYEFNQISQAMVKPTKMYWKAKNHVLGYLKGSTQYGLWYIKTEGVNFKSSPMQIR